MIRLAHNADLPAVTAIVRAAYSVYISGIGKPPARCSTITSP